jgi:hypothetical protein
MQNATSNDSCSTIRNESCHSVVANLVTLMEHLNVSRKMLELAIIRETTEANPDMDEDFVVLDDITPCYLSANTALSACNATLAVALHVLSGAYPTKVETRGSWGTDCGATGSVLPA